MGKRKHRKIMLFYKRLLVAMSITLVFTFSLTAAFFISRIRQELEDRAMHDLEFQSQQLTDTMNAKLGSIFRISNWVMTNAELNQKMNTIYENPYDYWLFYQYLSEFCDSLLEIEDSLQLITICIDNPSFKVDKENIRSLDEINGQIYEELQARGGGALFCMMKDAVSDSYFQYNDISSPDNICMLRVMEYNGAKSVLMMEIKSTLLQNEFSRQQGRGMYVADGDGRIIMYYENGRKLWRETLPEHIEEELKEDNIYLLCTLDNQWEISLFTDRATLLSGVDRDIRNLVIISFGITFMVLLVNSFVIRKISVQLLRLNEVIREEYQIEGWDDTDEMTKSRDEVEQVVDSFQYLMRRVEYLMNEVYKKELQNRNMELELLHSQIKPHFLYNTLSSIASLARKYQDEKLMNMINALSDMYRISLSKGENIITVEKEIEMTRSYLYIMENRFEDLIHVEFRVQKEALPGLVPKILLQPFVENSINYAICPDRILNIIIDIRKVEGKLLFQIYDDGLGMDEEQVKALLSEIPDDTEDGHGYGIPNVQRRIKVYMGEEYGIEIMSMKNVGTDIKMTMPFLDTPSHFRQSRLYDENDIKEE